MPDVSHTENSLLLPDCYRVRPCDHTFCQQTTTEKHSVLVLLVGAYSLPAAPNSMAFLQLPAESDTGQGLRREALPEGVRLVEWGAATMQRSGGAAQQSLPL